MIKLDVYHHNNVIHCATVEGQGVNSDTGDSVTYYKSWYGDNSFIMADGAAVILADQLGQGIARIYTEETPED